MTLVAFLRARLDDDEQVARAAGGPVWRYAQLRDDPDGRPGGYALTLGDDRPIVDIGFMDDDAMLPAESEHIARHDPARVLADVEAKRKLIKRYELAVDITENHTSITPFLRGQDDGYTQACMDLIRAAAEVYADHSDYDESWRP